MANFDNRDHFGFQNVSIGEKQGMVDDVFHSVAKNYDVMNDAMSMGVHRLWKDAMMAWLSLSKNRQVKVLDVAGGTGDIAKRIAEKSHKNSHITVLDINHEMLKVGRERFKGELADKIDFVQGNAEHLPYADNSFDIYTIALGIRNVPDIPQALREAYRVLKPGGRFMCLEFSKVDIPIFEKIYEAYSFHAIPKMGKLIAGDEESYQYLVESIRQFPNPDVFEDMISDAGFSRVTYRRQTGGIVALHSGWKI